MTCIAADARAGVMVCDSRITIGDVWVPGGKVQRFGDELIGCAGSDADMTRWRKWYIGGKRGARPKCENFATLILRPTGLFYVYDGGHEMIVDRGFHAVGSGGSAAAAVMIAGFDAVRAVEIACQVDSGCGGEVVTHRLVL